MTEPAEVSPAVDWSAPGRLRAGPTMPLLIPLPAIGLATVAVGVLASPLWGTIVAVALVAAAGAWILTRVPVLLRRIGARELQAGEEPRLENLAAGIAADLGIDAPCLYEIPQRWRNALVAWNRQGGVVAVSRGQLDATRTQLEAIVAHCLVRLATGEARRATVAVAWDR